VEFNNSSIVDIPTNEQELNTIETKFSGDSDLLNERSKKTFPSFFKTALEIRNEEQLHASKSDRNEKIQFKKLSMEDIEMNRGETRNEKSVSYNSVQKTTHKDDIPQMQMSGDFVCARKIHEIDMHLSSSSTRSSKSKYDIRSSTPKVHRSKEDKNVKKSNKTVYEQILASARSFSKNNSATCEAKSKTNDIAYPKSEDKTKNENMNNSEFAKCRKDSDMKISLETGSKVVSFIKDEKHKILDKNKGKRSCESTEYFDNSTKSTKKKKVVYNELNNKIHNYVSERNIAENIVNDIIDMEAVKNNTDKITNINIKDKQPSIKKKDRIKRSFETENNLVSEKEREPVSSAHFKRHEQNKNNNRIKVPADRATQFKTAEILKSYLMKYYPSERIPDRATFSKTCREMHYNMLKKKIFGKIILKFYIVI